MKKYLFVIIVIFCFTKLLAQNSLIWEPVPRDNQNKSNKLSNKESVLSDYKLFRLNFDLLQTKLETDGTGANQEYALIQLPDASGQLVSFRVVESSIMHPDLQSRYSSIRTYKGVGIEDPTATLRFSVSPLGFHALSLSGIRSALYIEPYSKNDDSLHMVFEKDDINKMNSDFECYVETCNRTSVRSLPHASKAWVLLSSLCIAYISVYFICKIFYFWCKLVRQSIIC
jgi:hypothetical protein